MIRSLIPFSAVSLALALAACSAGADQAEAPLPEGAWQLAADQSNVGFVSVKAGNVGEAHSFRKLSGTVEPEGTVRVAIDLASVDTGIDIRNQRMRDMLFEVANFPEARLTAKIDPNAVKALKPGERKAMTVPVTLDLHGTTNSIEAPLTVTRLAGDTVLVETAKPLIIDASAVGLEAGGGKLQEIAKLPAISTAVPVTASLVFKPKG
ncbi:YceI family protein [Blastomonas sp. UPD001]|uniref:YceI family protein n=1 Tax=Blastomonas sp. UPD001 TaxID=2217673 RepID=UPI000E342004|nr:YceI family protein [Blastomonas sp. UPD001]